MAKILRACLVSPGHLGSNPRLVKEADALAEAGYQVQVISGDSYPAARVRDESILTQARWASKIIPLRPGRVTYLYRRLRQRICQKLFAAGLQTAGIALRAHHALGPALARAAASVPADIYIGHCLAALPAAVHAGAKNRALTGFDAEDFHSGEVADSGHGKLENAIARAIEKKFLARCAHLTAASPLIARAYADLCGVQALPLLNVFPLAEAVAPQPAPETPAFYWFSQTIGSGRGLEEFIAILGRMKQKVRLDLRGHTGPAYAAALQEQVRGSEIELRLLPPDLPHTMVANAAGYTAGLGLELSEPRNRDICLTNKAFTYLLAGVPVILSRTAAQIQLAADLGEAAVLIDLKEVNESARRLDAWLADPGSQTKSRNQAFELGREKYNWEHEKQKLLAALAATFERAA